jgi:hypothetical protein
MRLLWFSFSALFSTTNPTIPAKYFKGEKMKTTKTIILLFLSFLLIIPVTATEQLFYDKDILIIGRCRTTYSYEGQWVGGLYIGFSSYAGINADNNREHIRVIIRDNHTTIFNLNTNKVFIFMLNSSGILFWGQKGSFDVRFIAPVVFIWSHAESIRLDTGVKNEL